MKELALRACLVVVACAAATAQAKRPSPSAVLDAMGEKVGPKHAYLPRSSLDRRDYGEDRTLAPYLYVAGDSAEHERLPLKETRADIRIAGVIAQVQVTQVFANEGKSAIEAVYVFPGSTRSAVHGMRMRIGERTIEAKIEKREEARQQYERAKQEGKRASLLEQERPNVFTMNVANVMPGDRIEVQLDYSELLIPEDGVYELHYPAVVGPRFGGGADAEKDQWLANPHLPAGQAEPYAFGLKVHLETGLPLKQVTSPSHAIDVSYSGERAADVALKEKGGGNKDFVLRYRLSGDRIETGLLLFEGEDERFFLMMMEPPARPPETQIPPREYVFLLDVSGSMRGYPLDTSKALMKRLLGQLRVDDYFNVAFFSGGSWMMSPEASLPATPTNIEMAAELVGRARGGGGTQLMDGLRTAYALPRHDPAVSRSVIVVTDGYVAVESQAYKFIRERLDEANVFAFGIGSSVNRALIEGMARAGQGEPFIVFGPEKADAVAQRLGEYIRQPVMSNIAYRFDGFGAREVAPMKLPDLMARRPLVLFGKYRGPARGRIVITGHGGQGPVNQTVNVAEYRASAANSPIRYLWARKWVAFMDDELAMTGGAQELVDVITDLGLSYDLLTKYTSFVAVDSEVVNRSGESDSVRQPLPMPRGVPNEAAARMSLRKGGAAGPAMAPRSMAAPAPPPGVAGAASMESARMSRSMKRKRVPRPAAEDALEGGGEATPRLMVLKVEAEGLADPKAAVAALEKRLGAVAAACKAESGTLVLRLTLDAKGVVTRAVVVKGEKRVGACVSARLKGVATQVTPSRRAATLTLTLKAMRL